MRCGWRFGKSFLRARVGCGHLTERQPRCRGRDRGLQAPAPPGDSEREEHDTCAAHEREQQPSRSVCPGTARCGRSGHRSVGRTPMLERSGAGPDGTRARDRRAGGRGRMRLPHGRPRSRGTRASSARDSFDSLSCGRRCPRGRDRGHRLRADERTGAPPRDAARTTRAWTTRRPARLHGGWRRPDRLGRGRSRRSGLLRRARLRLTHRSRRQQRQRVEVAVRIRGQANAEVDVRLAPLGLAARADRRDDVSFLDRGSGGHADRAEMHERDRVTVRSPNRQAEPLARQPPGEGDDAGCRRTKVGACGSSDVDAAMLAAGVRVVLGRERPQDRSLDGPGPPGRRLAEDERKQHPDGQDRDFVA
jgi:hypothetical protein